MGSSDLQVDVNSVRHAITANDIWATVGDSQLAHAQNIMLDQKYYALPNDTWDMLINTALAPVVYVKQADPPGLRPHDYAFYTAGWFSMEFDINGVAAIISPSQPAYNALMVVESGKLSIRVIDPTDPRTTITDKVTSSFAIW